MKNARFAGVFSPSLCASENGIVVTQFHTRACAKFFESAEYINLVVTRHNACLCAFPSAIQSSCPLRTTAVFPSRRRWPSIWLKSLETNWTWPTSKPMALGGCPPQKLSGARSWSRWGPGFQQLWVLCGGGKMSPEAVEQSPVSRAVAAGCCIQWWQPEKFTSETKSRLLFLVSLLID